ncbi:hypothetical protein TcWFU_004706 [Taenia crassiceps]|uniref:Uncharacterized protein n=1 Tax=Taenia crassiceps TaxID=6207 RepID=A0ABR4Q845_9CEST
MKCHLGSRHTSYWRSLWSSFAWLIVQMAVFYTATEMGNLAIENGICKVNGTNWGSPCKASKDTIDITVKDRPTLLPCGLCSQRSRQRGRGSVTFDIWKTLPLDWNELDIRCKQRLCRHGEGRSVRFAHLPWQLHSTLGRPMGELDMGNEHFDAISEHRLHTKWRITRSKGVQPVRQSTSTCVDLHNWWEMNCVLLGSLQCNSQCAALFGPSSTDDSWSAYGMVEDTKTTDKPLTVHM